MFISKKVFIYLSIINKQILTNLFTMTIHETKINENSYFYINRFAEEHNYNRCCYKSGRTWYYETPANYYKALRRAVKKELLKKRTNRQAFVSSISEQKIGVRIKLENNY